MTKEVHDAVQSLIEVSRRTGINTYTDSVIHVTDRFLKEIKKKSVSQSDHLAWIEVRLGGTELTASNIPVTLDKLLSDEYVTLDEARQIRLGIWKEKG